MKIKFWKILIVSSVILTIIAFDRLNAYFEFLGPKHLTGVIYVPPFVDGLSSKPASYNLSGHIEILPTGGYLTLNSHDFFCWGGYSNLPKQGPLKITLKCVHIGSGAATIFGDRFGRFDRGSFLTQDGISGTFTFGVNTTRFIRILAMAKRD